MAICLLSPVLLARSLLVGPCEVFDRQISSSSGVPQCMPRVTTALKRVVPKR